MMDEPMSPKQVAEAVGRHPNNVRQLMWKMANDGELRSCGGGKYTITDNTDNSDNNIEDNDDDNCYRVTDVIAYPAVQATAMTHSILQPTNT